MQPSFEEKFQDQLNPDWQFVREDSESKLYALDQEGLKMTIVSGHLWGKSDKSQVKNILLRPVPSEHFKASADLSFSALPKISGEQAGLIWYLDDNNYIKLCVEYLKEQTHIVMAKEANNEPAVIKKVPVDLSDLNVSLQLEASPAQSASSATFTSRYSIGETVKEWTELASCAGIEHDLQAKPRIGLFTCGGDPEQGRYVTVRRFAIALESQCPHSQASGSQAAAKTDRETAASADPASASQTQAQLQGAGGAAHFFSLCLPPVLSEQVGNVVHRKGEQ